MKTKLALIAVAGLAAVTLAGCEKPIEAPYDTGVCWHVAPQKDGTMKFNVLAKNQPNVENCAAALEGMRIRFNRMGMNQQQLIGAYQGTKLISHWRLETTSRRMISSSRSGKTPAARMSSSPRKGS